MRKQKKRNPEYVREYNRKYYAENRAMVREKNKKYQKEKTRKYTIKRKLAYHSDPAFRRKIIARVHAERWIPLDRQSCEKCGSKKMLGRHHSNYSDPLKVRILCSLCHGLEHRKELEGRE